MKPVVVSVDVHAPADRVFEAVSDMPNAADRVSGITRIEMLSDGPVGAGTRWRETRTMFGREATEEMWITEFDPPNRYVVEARSHGAHYLTPVTVEPVGAGLTRLSMSFGATPETLAAKIMSRIMPGMRRMVRKCLQQDLDDIKAWCEREQPASG